MAKYQNQHFVPKTYLKAWGKPNPNNPNPKNNDWIVSGYNKETGEFEEDRKSTRLNSSHAR